MQFANYNAFRVACQKLIEGDDTAGNTFSVNTLDLMIALAESRVYRDLRATTMEKPLSVVVASNAAALPADLIELNEVYFSGGQPLQVITLDRYRTLSAIGVPNGATTCVCAQDGDTLRFWPAATGTVLGSYYAKPDPLETITWANATTFARYPELFLYATLVEAMPMLGMEANLQLWETKYQQALNNAAHDERMRVYGGSPLRIRAR
jgi:hypothetical protein